MIALLLAIIKSMFFHWKEEHIIETMSSLTAGERPGNVPTASESAIQLND